VNFPLQKSRIEALSSSFAVRVLTFFLPRNFFFRTPSCRTLRVVYSRFSRGLWHCGSIHTCLDLHATFAKMAALLELSRSHLNAFADDDDDALFVSSSLSVSSIFLLLCISLSLGRLHLRCTYVRMRCTRYRDKERTVSKYSAYLPCLFCFFVFFFFFFFFRVHHGNLLMLARIYSFSPSINKSG